MLFLGHIAVSLLIANATRSDRAAAVAGNLVPDVIDKTAGWVLHASPSRWLAHGLPFFVACAIVAALALDPARRRGFILGYGGHLICDLWGGYRVPWFAPFQKRPRRHALWGKGRAHHAIYILPELIGVPIIWRLLIVPNTESVRPADLAR